MYNKRDEKSYLEGVIIKYLGQDLGNTLIRCELRRWNLRF